MALLIFVFYLYNSSIHYLGINNNANNDDDDIDQCNIHNSDGQPPLKETVYFFC